MSDPDIQEALKAIDEATSTHLRPKRAEQVRVLLMELQGFRDKFREVFKDPEKPKRRPKEAWWLDQEHQVDGSTNIKAARFVLDQVVGPDLPGTGELFIAFQSGGVYKYKAVPFGIWKAFQENESKGRYFHKFIRAVYACERVV